MHILQLAAVWFKIVRLSHRHGEWIVVHFRRQFHESPAIHAHPIGEENPDVSVWPWTA